MNTLVRYVLWEQIKILALTLTALTGISFAVAVLDKLRVFLSHGTDPLTMVEYFALGLPKNIAEMAPFALLIATVLALGGLSARSEVVAMRAAGISVLRVVAPLLSLGLLASVVLGWGAMSFVPHANALAARLLNQGMGAEQAVFSRNRIWFKGPDDTIFGIRSAEADGTTLWGVRILKNGPNGQVAELTQAERMVYEDGRWALHNGRTVAANGDDLALLPFDSAPAPALRPPAELGDVSVPQSELSYGRLGDYVQRLRADGYDASGYQMAQAQRLAYPFSAFVMVLMAIPHGLTPPRSHNLSKGIAISLGLALGFWLIYSLSVALGRAGLLPPLLAAWLPLGICAAYGTNRLLAVRQ